MTENETYPETRRARRVAGVHDGGHRLALDDGSVWDVYAGFVSLTSAWTEGQMVSVKPGRDPDYPYKLINVHRNESVEARWLGHG